MMPRSVLACCAVLLAAASREATSQVAETAAPPKVPGGASTYMIGADLSAMKAAEDRGTVFKDGGQAKPGLEIFKDHGYGWIRLRLFHTPTQLPNNLNYTIALAKSAKQLGYKFLLDYHYSDTWADPGKQFVPKAWEGRTHKQLVVAVRDYTRETTAAFRDAGVLPDMVQIGNEITNGMIWPDAKLQALFEKGEGTFEKYLAKAQLADPSLRAEKFRAQLEQARELGLITMWSRRGAELVQPLRQGDG
ncbi:MAG: glycosyl hydrolase 53 family protein, partial [bacterium]